MAAHPRVCFLLPVFGQFAASSHRCCNVVHTRHVLVLLQDYDNLAAEKAKLEEQARCAKPLRASPSRRACGGTGRYLFTKKRNAINERKRISQQKEEADE